MFIENPEYEGKPSKKFKAVMVDHPLVPEQRSFEEYKGRYTANWMLDRTENGILTAKWHSDGHDLDYNVGFHRSVGQLMEDIGQDADTEVLILGGHGETFLNKFKALFDEEANLSWYAYEHMFYDGVRMISSLVNSLRIPTIGVINGNGYHSELAVLCDITLMAEDAVISDPHFTMGAIPGDGVQTALRKTIGIKRANYAMLMNDQIDAQKALDYGLVNEILPRDQLYDRAMEIAQFFMTRPRIARRLTAEILKQPWQKALAEELRPNFGMEMWSFFANPKLTHDSAFKAIAEWRKMYEKRPPAQDKKAK